MDKTVLLVDDDQKLTDLLTEYLRGNGFTVLVLGDGIEVMETIQQAGPDMMILDIMLPGADGLDILKEIRKTFTLPVIMLTAKGEETDRIIGLELGADDYLSKPFNPRELLARIKAVLRRSSAVNGDVDARDEKIQIRSGDLLLDQSRRIFWVGKEKLDLSSTEFELLKALMSRPDTVLNRDRLISMTRGKDHMVLDRSIDVHISNLRAKLAPYPASRDRIKTVWGEGYLFVGEK